MNGAEATGQAGYLMVRSRLADPADRAAFDRWYDDNHAPLAARKLGARSGRRFWSVTDPQVHCALYAFDSLEALQAAMASEVAQWLIADYDRYWPEPRVTRSREIWADAGEVDIGKAEL